MNQRTRFLEQMKSQMDQMDKEFKEGEEQEKGSREDPG